MNKFSPMNQKNHPIFFAQKSFHSLPYRLHLTRQQSTCRERGANKEEEEKNQNNNMNEKKISKTKTQQRRERERETCCTYYRVISIMCKSPHSLSVLVCADHPAKEIFSRNSSPLSSVFRRRSFMSVEERIRAHVGGFQQWRKKWNKGRKRRKKKKNISCRNATWKFYFFQSADLPPSEIALARFSTYPG